MSFIIHNFLVSSSLLELPLPVSLYLQWTTATLHHNRRLSNTSRQVWPSLLGCHCFLPCVLVCMRSFVCPPRVEFLFFSILWNSFSQTPFVFNSILSGGSSSHFQAPKLGSLPWGSGLSLLWENLCVMILLQFVGHPPGGYRTWVYYCPPTVLLWLLCHWIQDNILGQSVQSLSHVRPLANPWTTTCQASLSITNSWSFLKCMPIELVMPSNHLILCHPLLLLTSIFPSIRVFSNESVLHIRWPEYWSFSFSISPSNEYSGLISFRIEWFDLFAVQGTLKSLLQHHSSKHQFFCTLLSL